MRARWAMALLLIAGVARAEDPETEKKYAEALDLRSKGEDARALEILRAIEANLPSGRSLAQTALAEQALGSWSKAEEDLVAAFARGGPWIEKNRAALEAALATTRRHLGTLEITCARPCDKTDTTLLLDGKEVGALPLSRPLRLTTGTHRVGIRLASGETTSRDVEIGAGKLVREELDPGPPRLESPRAESALAAAASPHRPPEHGGTSSLAPLVGGSLLALGGLSLGATVAFGIVSNGKARDYNDDPACGAVAKPARCVDLRSDTTAYRTGAWITGAVGGALVVTGIVVIALSPSKRSEVSVRGTTLSFSTHF